jgi:hypothetical protein
MWMRIVALLLFWLLFTSPVPPACEWTRGTEVGRVDTPISEDSGLAISRKFPNRLYHANDSGDSGRFFVTDLTGSGVRVVRVNNFDPRDVEDLAIGPCGATDCLFIGDIGDNSRNRGTIELIAIQDRERFPPRIDATYRVRLRYPDGAHDAEALAVHPDGTVFVLTKGGIPQLYRLKRELWTASSGRVETLEHVIAIDFEKLGGAAAAIDGRLPTAMDISPDGKGVLVLTYRNVFELFFDLSRHLPPAETWKPGLNYRRINMEVLPQQESIAFTPDGHSFLYDTEKPSNGPARIMRFDCR